MYYSGEIREGIVKPIAEVDYKKMLQIGQNTNALHTKGV